MFKSKILKMTDIEPLDEDEFGPGSLAIEVKEGKPVGPKLRIVQIAGMDVLVNYQEEKGAAQKG